MFSPLFDASDIDHGDRQFVGFGGMGGMGGMGSMGGMGGFDDNSMDGTSRFGAFGGMPGGMPRNRGASTFRSTQAPDPGPQSNGASAPSEIVRPLKVSLEELFTGTTKRLKIGRRLLSGATEEKILEIEVQASAFFFVSLSVYSPYRFETSRVGKLVLRSAFPKPETNNHPARHKMWSS
jgi:hypothetical protein